MTTLVRELKEDDFDRFKSFMLEHFYGQEPLFQTPGDHKKCPITPEGWSERINIIRQGLSLAAVDENDRIVGVAFAKAMQPEELKKSWKVVNRKRPTDLSSHCFYFLSKLEWDSLIFERYNVSKALYLHLLCVDSTMRRQGLGGCLVSALKEVGHSKGFPLLFSTCTSHYSTQIMAAQGLEVVIAAKFADYKDDDGNTPIRPPAPHTETVIMAIRL